MSSKGGLGKGLSALMGDAAKESGSGAQINELPIKDIIPNPNQPRTNFDEESIEELAASIEKEGLLQPIIVRPSGNKYQIVAGERRWHACRSLDMQTIPVRVMPLNEAKTLEIALIENLQRTNLNAIEEARGYKTLINETGMKQEEVASAVSKSRTTITNALRLLDLPEVIQEMLFDGKITAGHARAILSVSDEDKRLTLANKVVEAKLSVRETENMARLYSMGQSVQTKRAAAPRSFKTVARKLRQQLGTDVRVKNSRGKNRIEIEFSDELDLQRIYDLIAGQSTIEFLASGSDIEEIDV